MSEFIDNRAKRIETLKEIIRKLHRGVPPEEVKAELKEIVRHTDSSEVAAMEQELMAEGMKPEEVQSMCDLHSQVLRDLIRETPGEEHLEAGHPVETMSRENEALLAETAAARKVLERLGGLCDDEEAGELIGELRDRYNSLMDVDKHYRRKENLLFPYLEKHGITGPSKVMWGKDDEVREMLKALGEALAESGAGAGEWKVVAGTLAGPALDAIEEMVSKERQILFPMSLEALTPDEWAEVWRQSPEYGWCLVEPGDEYSPPEKLDLDKAAGEDGRRAVSFDTGSLDFRQIRGMLRALPVDITFVDADDRVAFFSEGDRIFDRSKAIIGRKVQHCHPPGSVDVVERIVGDFRAGRQDVAEFWIQSGGKFIHIRYFAVRDDAGEYIGTLEVTQDLTAMRALEGERRLLAYD